MINLLLTILSAAAVVALTLGPIAAWYARAPHWAAAAPTALSASARRRAATARASELAGMLTRTPRPAGLIVASADESPTCQPRQ